MEAFIYVLHMKKWHLRRILPYFLLEHLNNLFPQKNLHYKLHIKIYSGFLQNLCVFAHVQIMCFFLHFKIYFIILKWSLSFEIKEKNETIVTVIH